MNSYSFKGFSLKETRELPDIYSTAYLFTHNKTRAEVLYLKNKDQNKAFTISFATPPYDHNGIAHIIEHSVLNGSKKYPTKEPFVQLLKGSLNTFLNAMTFSDKTVYPVASQNEKDFQNLMSVYLDAVFCPNMVSNPQILMQEGWHYHLEDEKDELIYKGVVYNEMKGAFSQPESELYMLIERKLFPDTIYANVSAGLPEFIPTLTQEKFVDFYQTYYHPSNAKVILYGDMDLTRSMEQLEEYFSQYEAKEIRFDQFTPAPFSEIAEEVSYFSVAHEEERDKKSMHSFSWAVGKGTDVKMCMAFSILEDLLMGSNVAPLKKALLKAEIGSEVSGGFSAYSYTPSFTIVLKDSQPEYLESFKQIIYEELGKIVENGFSKEAIQAALNKTAFRYKEATSSEGGTPKGVSYGIHALTSWLYGGSPYDSFEFNTWLKELEQEAKNGLFERMVDEYLIHNTHALVLSLLPQVGLLEKKEKDLAQKLKEYKDSLSKEELNQLIQDTKDLIKRQGEADSPEALKTIPKLSREDIQSHAEEYPLQVIKDNSIEWLFYEGNTSGIGYGAYYFDLSVVPTELLPVAGFLTELLSELATTMYSENELTTAIDFYTGGIFADTVIFQESVKNNLYYPKFKISGKALSVYLPKMIHLIQEIMMNSRLEDVHKIKEILLITKADLEMNFHYEPHQVAYKRLQSYVIESAQYSELLEGIDYYDYLVDVLEDLEERLPKFLEDLKEVHHLIFQRGNVVATFTGSKEDFETFKRHSIPVLNELNDENLVKQPFTKALEIKNEGFKTSQEVQYVAKGYNQTLLDYPLDGKIFFIKTLIRLEYFWDEIRVKGGAYDGMAIVNSLGDVAGVSYRDPNLKETFEIYRKTGEFLKNYYPSSEEFEKTLIGTFSTLDRPLSVAQKGSIAFSRYFTHVTQEKVQRLRDQILQATPEKIRAFAKTMDEIMQQDIHVVIGNGQRIEENKEQFKQIRSLIR